MKYICTGAQFVSYRLFGIRFRYLSFFVFGMPCTTVHHFHHTVRSRTSATRKSSSMSCIPEQCFMFRNHDSFFRLMGLFPSIFPLISKRSNSYFSPLSKCPKYAVFWHLITWKISLSTSTLLSTFSLMTLCILGILSRHLNDHISNASSRFIDFTLSEYVSTPYSNIRHS